jgi:hypothetical protein
MPKGIICKKGAKNPMPNGIVLKKKRGFPYAKRHNPKKFTQRMLSKRFSHKEHEGGKKHQEGKKGRC